MHRCSTVCATWLGAYRSWTKATLSSFQVSAPWTKLATFSNFMESFGPCATDRVAKTEVATSTKHPPVAFAAFSGVCRSRQWIEECACSYLQRYARLEDRGRRVGTWSPSQADLPQAKDRALRSRRHHQISVFSYDRCRFARFTPATGESTEAAMLRKGWCSWHRHRPG